MRVSAGVEWGGGGGELVQGLLEQDGFDVG